MKKITPIFIISLLSLLYSTNASAQSEFQSFLQRNVAHIEMDASLELFCNYRKPTAINHVSVIDNKIKIDYNMYNDINYVVTIDISKSIPEIEENSPSSISGSSSFEYAVSFHSTSNISKVATYKKDGIKHTSSRKSFSIYCESYDIAKSLYNIAFQYVNKYLPHFDYSDQGVKECFSNIQNIAREYKITSSQVAWINSNNSRFAKTSNVRFSFSNNILSLSYIDAYDENGVSGGGYFYPGKCTCQIPIYEASISYSSYGHATNLSIVVPKGMTFQRNSEKTIVKGVTLCADDFVIIDLTQHILKFQDLVKTTGFSGTLGVSTSTSKSKSSPNSNAKTPENKNISDKFGL